MAPKLSKPCRPATAAEKAAALHQRAVEIQTNGQIKEIHAILKSRRDLVAGTLQHLYSLGASQSSTPGPAPPESTKRLAIMNGEATTDGDTGIQDEAEPADVAEPPKQKSRFTVLPIIPRCHQTFGATPPHYWQHVLALVEPSSLSEAAQGALRPSGSRHVPKLAITQLVEMMTEWCMTDDITNHLRVVEHLVAEVMVRSRIRSRPCQGMVLPPRWHEPGVGIFSIVKEKKKFFFVDRIYNQKMPVPDSFVKMVKDMSTVKISHNWSQTNAEAIDQDGHARLKLATVFDKPMMLQKRAEMVGDAA